MGSKDRNIGNYGKRQPVENIGVRSWTRLRSRRLRCEDVDSVGLAFRVRVRFKLGAGQSEWRTFAVANGTHRRRLWDFCGASAAYSATAAVARHRAVNVGRLTTRSETTATTGKARDRQEGAEEDGGEGGN